MDILYFGEPLVEFNQQGDGRYLEGYGDDVSNCAIAAARSGACVGMMDAVGRSPFGDSFMALWSREGIGTARVHRDPSARTGVYFVTHGPDGHAFSYLRAGSAASRMVPDNLRPEDLADVALLHVSGISQAISASATDAVFAAIELAHAAGARVSYDTNLRRALWPLPRAVIHAGIAASDIAVPGLEDAEAFTGQTKPEAIVGFYLDLGPKIVALTLGRDGTLVATPERRTRVPAGPVEAVDATGAGDTFDGASLARLAAGDAPEDAARYANAAAALSTLGYGADAPIPRPAAVANLVAAQPVS